jgi:hypothetical protein
MSELESPENAGAFRRGLLGLVLLGGISQALIQSQAFTENPLVLVPQVDAMVIWEHAGATHSGESAGDRPFDTAPLILWLAAALRSLGGGLAAWGGLQSVLHVAAAVLLALATRSFARNVRPGAGAGPLGLVAGALFLLLDEPAASTSRVLSGSLQLFLGSALLLALAPRPSALDAKRSAIAGALLGLLCLACPPMMVGVPLLGVWAFFRSGRGVREASVLVGAAALAIAPATIHNYRATGELIPISAQAGLTFYHGNNVKADGTISPYGVVNDKGGQALDSLEQARAALGESAGWKDASSYWMGQGLDWWSENPAAGVKLAFTKLWYGISGRNYGDVYQPWREREAGVASRLWLAPLPVAWLVPAALVMLFILLRSAATRWSSVPLLVFVAVPMAVVVTFFYTPRYRLAGVVAFVPLASLALGALLSKSHTAQDRRRTVLLGLAVVVGVGSGLVNRAVGFDTDRTGMHRLRFIEAMAAANGKLDRHGDGARYLHQLVQLDPENGENRGRLLDLCWYLAASSNPDEKDPEAAVEIATDLVTQFGPAPGLLDLRATAKAALGDFVGAGEDLAQALESLRLQGVPAGDPTRVEIEQRKSLFAAGQPFQLSSSNN